MIKSFWQMVAKEDPAFITGFNDSGFDIPYLRDKQEFFKEDASARSLLPFYCFLQAREICIFGNASNPFTVAIDNGILEQKSITHTQYNRLVKHCQKHVFSE
jgi:hypothetical protein